MVPRQRLVLASASPRRREILAALGIDFEVVVPEVEEIREGRPEELVVENALRKAHAGLETAGGATLVLGVDTDVVLDGRTLGKAGDEVEARARLESLSGRTHAVLSGVALVTHSEERTDLTRSLITFRELEPETIELYVRSGEWRDRAGAYAIQGLGSILVERLEGDFSNVVGLPVTTLLGLLPDLLAKP